MDTMERNDLASPKMMGVVRVFKAVYAHPL